MWDQVQKRLFFNTGTAKMRIDTLPSILVLNSEPGADFWTWCRFLNLVPKINPLPQNNFLAPFWPKSLKLCNITREALKIIWRKKITLKLTFLHQYSQLCKKIPILFIHFCVKSVISFFSWPSPPPLVITLYHFEL